MNCVTRNVVSNGKGNFDTLQNRTEAAAERAAGGSELTAWEGR